VLHCQLLQILEFVLLALELMQLKLGVQLRHCLFLHVDL